MLNEKFGKLRTEGNETAVESLIRAIANHLEDRSISYYDLSRRGVLPKIREA